MKNRVLLITNTYTYIPFSKNFGLHPLSDYPDLVFVVDDHEDSEKFCHNR